MTSPVAGESKSRRPFLRSGPAGAALLACSLFIAGCVSNPTPGTACDGNNFDQVMLQPGCSTICFQEPCRVFFRMPPGKGSYLVRGSAMEIGEYPAGETVYLGSFWKGGHRITVEGANAPTTWLWVSGGSDSGIGAGY